MECRLSPAGVDGKHTQHAEGDVNPSPKRGLFNANFESEAEEAGRLSISEVVFWENHQKQLKSLSEP